MGGAGVLSFLAMSKCKTGCVARASAFTVLLGSAVVGLGCGKTSDPGNIGGSRYAALEHAPMSTATEAESARAGHSIQNVFLIVMENHNWSDVHGNPSAPYVNDTLLTMGAHAENYFDNPSAAHPSEPNYVWLEAGDNLGIADDDDPDMNNRTTHMHLTSLLNFANVSWKSYQEGIDGTSCPIVGNGLYAPKHNPMMFFDDITDGNSPSSAGCIAHVRPYAELAQDLANDTVAQYNFITPNLCDDMHNSTGCSTGDAVKNGDAWLATNLPQILGSSAYQRGGAVFITWDESEDGEHPIGMIALSPFAKTGYASSVPLSHSSMLRSAQEILGVTPLLRDAANATDLSDLFVSFP